MAAMDFFTNRLWRMREDVLAPSRFIIGPRDVLEFARLSETRAELIVHDADTDLPALASRIKLRLIKDLLIGEDYGREITFSQKSANVITYAANYLTGSGEQPDEGGDGDPK